SLQRLQSLGRSEVLVCLQVAHVLAPLPSCDDVVRDASLCGFGRHPMPELVRVHLEELATRIAKAISLETGLHDGSALFRSTTEEVVKRLFRYGINEQRVRSSCCMPGVAELDE